MPLLVSIGYSACHWCHVMEHESFEDPRVAALMNEEFVCVKVDREERPDVDALYMEAVQGMTGHGGWPLNVFLTPEQTPFYGGTYFPPEPRHGLPSWTPGAAGDRGDVARERGGDSRGGRARARAARRRGTHGALRGAVRRGRARCRGRRAGGSFDTVNGGFGGAPKFPQTPVLEFLLRHGEREMSLATLRSMARGGIHDQLGGGFHRYSVDAAWTVPHFEKMLYDNALLARAYLHGYRLSGEAEPDGQGDAGDGASGRESGPGSRRDEELARVCRTTLEWMLRDGAADPRAASTPRSTPTPRAWRAATTCGPSGSSRRCSARTPTPRRGGWA